MLLSSKCYIRCWYALGIQSSRDMLNMVSLFTKDRNIEYFVILVGANDFDTKKSELWFTKREGVY